MANTVEDFRQHFSSLSDEALLEVERGDLVDTAQSVLDEEIATRGLAVEEPAEADAVPEASVELVPVARFATIDEARFAKDLLKGAGIPSYFAAELTPNRAWADPSDALELLTTPEFKEQAQLALESEVSEEDLAAQAEAAGSEEEIELAELAADKEEEEKAAEV